MNERLKNKNVVLISAVVMVVVLVLGFTLALWSRNFTQTGTNRINTDCFNITYSETDAVTLNNAYPQTDEDGLRNTAYEVTIENTCNTVNTYTVLLNEIEGNTLAENHVKVAINDSYKMLNSYDSATPSTEINNASSARKLMTGILPGNSTRTVSVKSWMDENTSEAEGENKTFAYRITIETTATTKNLLAAEILKTPITRTAIDYSQLPTSGLYAANDNDGESYFYRGNIDNNYVDLGLTFPEAIPMFVVGENGGGDVAQAFTTRAAAEEECNGHYTAYLYESTQECIADIQDRSVAAGDPMLFRIVRINGDGTIRLISDNVIGNSAYNSTDSGHKYVGYTYDNNKVCTASSPCTGTEGTNSIIKTYLDTWYTSNIASTSINNKIATTTYCNDTSYTADGDNYTYNSYNRIYGLAPSLECGTTNAITENYGGVYKLKVGLASGDEINMAGYGDLDMSTYAPLSNYMYTPKWFWAGSPDISAAATYACVVSTVSGGSIYNNCVKSSIGVRPGINLTSDVLVSTGNGTKTSPYVILP